MKFSKRIPANLFQNLLTVAINSTDKNSYINLTDSNPTLSGFEYPNNFHWKLQNKITLNYDPSPFGSDRARKAIARYLNLQGQNVNWNQIVITSGTSEAYSYLFKLLVNPGESVLVPNPGYPLLDHLVELEGSTPVFYSLDSSQAWSVNLDHIRAAPSNTKAIVTINPHNPTGYNLLTDDKNNRALENIILNKNMALISDEVFENYVYEPTLPKIKLNSEIFTFRLGGLSKSIGMPYFKLSWIIVECPPSNFNQCMERLELINDCYLSVNTPTQLVLEKLLSFAPYFQKQVRNRILKNISILGSSIASLLPRLKLWPSEGGWYGLIEVNPSTTNQETEKDENLVIKILNEEKVLVHPGSLYDFSLDKIFLVVSLLPESNIFAEGINRLKNYFMKN